MIQTKTKKFLCLVLATVMTFLSIITTPAEASAKDDIYSLIQMTLGTTKCTIYTNQTLRLIKGASVRYYSNEKYSIEKVEKVVQKVMSEYTWTTSDSSVVAFLTSYEYDEYNNPIPVTADTLENEIGSPTLVGIAPGTAKITVTSPLLKTSLSCKVTVVDAELDCRDEVFYYNNEYAFELKGNASPVRFTSSKPEVATVDETTGVVTALKKGKTIISCEATDGTIYKQTIKIQKPGLNYSKITSYYFTGYREGVYSSFPIVAKGIDVKKWKSSNTKVVKVLQKGNVGVLEIHGTGNCTVTCTDTSGKTYKCKVTIVGGKPWSGLNSGYRPTITEVKKHGYYDDINKIYDYGNVVFFIVDYAKEIDLKNGNKKMDIKTAEAKANEILNNRYPDKMVQLADGGDLLGFTSGKQYARLWIGCFYVEDQKSNLYSQDVN